MGPLLPPVRPVAVRVFLSKDGRGHVILSKEAVNLLRAYDFHIPGYLYLEVAGALAVLKQFESAEIPLEIKKKEALR